MATLEQLFSEDRDAVEAAVVRICVALSALLLASFVLLTFFDLRAVYGRYTSAKWGPTLPGVVDWYAHGTSLLAVALCVYEAGALPRSLAGRLCLLAFCVHYLNRSVVHAELVRPDCKPVPAFTTLLGSSFCWFNGLAIGRYLTFPGLASDLDAPGYAASPRFLVGMVLWAVGFVGNVAHDRYLLRLKREGAGYQIPVKFMFRYVSGANFLMEMVEWLGFLIACGGPPAAAFFVCTVCNIGPRAFHHHAWYREKFREAYPADRKALLPMVW